MIRNQSNSIRQIFNILEKYKVIISRSYIKNALYAHRQEVLSTLPKTLLELRVNLTQTQTLKSEISSVVVEIKWLHMVERHLLEIYSVCLLLLNELSTYDIVNETVKEFMEEIKASLTLSLKKWREDSLEKILSKNHM